jgi:serine/threonine protein kinase
MGEVWRATDTRLEREVALKVLPEEMAADRERLERFEREAKTVAALNHPNIVTIHSVEADEGRHFLTMELVEGKTLDQHIPADGLPLARLFDLAIPIADARQAVRRESNALTPSAGFRPGRALGLAASAHQHRATHRPLSRSDRGWVSRSQARPGRSLKRAVRQGITEVVLRSGWKSWAKGSVAPRLSRPTRPFD